MERKKMNNDVSLQLKTLLENGISLEDACETLGLDEDGARAFLSSESKKEVSAEDFIKEHKLICLRALVNIGLDSSIDNTSARVSALKIIVEGAGEMPALPIDKYSEVFKKMKNVTNKHRLAYENGTLNKTETLSLPGAKKEELVA